MSSVRENIAKYAAGGQEDNFCRLCFVKAFKLRNVFPYGDDPNSELFRQITSLALVKLNPDEEPDCCICSRCITMIVDFSKWRQQAVEYNRLLAEARYGQQKAPEEIVDRDNSMELLVELREPKEEKTDESDATVDDVDPFLAANDSTDSEQEADQRPQLRNPPRKIVRPARLSEAAQKPKKRTRGRNSSKKVKEDFEIEEPTIVATPLTVKINKISKMVKADQSESEPEFEEEALDSDGSFKPSPPNRRRSKPTVNKTSSVKRRKIPKGQDDSLETIGAVAVHSSSDFQVYNAGHGTVNISFGGFRYFKFRYYRSRAVDEVHYGWQCIEDDCNGQIFTRSSVKGMIFWKDRYLKHSHPEENYEELIAAKIESLEEQNKYSEDYPEQEVIRAGRKRHCYSLIKLPSGEEMMVYGDHKHYQLVEKPDGTRVFGCTLKKCRAIIFYPPDGKIRVYSGGTDSPEDSFDVTYRKSQQVIHYEGHYYVYSGRKMDGKWMIWHCLLRKQFNCVTLIYVADGDLVVSNRQQVKFAHTHGVGEYKLEDGMTIVEGRKGTLPVESTEYDVGKNASGTDYIIFEGSRYTVMHTKVDGTKACRCMEEQCGAYVYLTPGGVLVKFTNVNEHTHPVPDKGRPIEDFDYVIQTRFVERHAAIIKWYNGFEYKRQSRRDNKILFYRCVEQNNGCMASFTASMDFSSVRENPEQHSHGPVKREQERQQGILEDEGTTDYKMDVNGDGSEVLKYKDSRYCHFYNHKYGWRVWRCFQGARCRATMYQNRADGRIFDADRFEHKHDGTKRYVDVEETEASNEAKEVKRSYSDSDSRESADWF